MGESEQDDREVRTRWACTMSSRLRGLERLPPMSDVLVLAPCRDVHTFGMKEPIDIAFVGADGRVLAAYCNVRPRRRIRCREAKATLERFSVEQDWFDVGDYVNLTKGPRKGKDDENMSDLPCEII